MKIDKIVIDHKTNKIEISTDLYKGSFVYDISKGFNLETKNTKATELEVLNELFNVLIKSDYYVLEKFIVENGLELLKLQENMKSIQKKIRENVPSLFI